METKKQKQTFVIFLCLSFVLFISWIFDFSFVIINFKSKKIVKINFWICESSIIVQITLNIYVIVLLHKVFLSKKEIGKCNIPIYLNCLIISFILYAIFYPRTFIIFLITVQSIYSIFAVGFIENYLKNNKDEDEIVDSNDHNDYFYNPELPDNVVDNSSFSDSLENYQIEKVTDGKCLNDDIESKVISIILQKNENENDADDVSIPGVVCSNPYSNYNVDLF